MHSVSPGRDRPRSGPDESGTDHEDGLPDDVELWVVRHGETEWSRDGRHTSTTDLDLTTRGEEQARALLPALGQVSFDRVLTSPLARARRTAELAGHPGAERDADLAEWDYGDFEGLRTEQIREQVPGWTIWSGPWPHGENAQDVAARLDRVVAAARQGGRTLVFSHGHASRVLAARWLGLPAADGGDFCLDTATVSILGAEHGRAAVRRWNAPV